MLTVIFQIMKEDRPKSEGRLQKVTEQLSANVKSDGDQLNKSIEEGIETEVSKLNFMITSLREENRHDIKNVNSKVNNLSEFVGEMIHEYVAETKKVHNDINNELKKHKLETESVLTNIRPELSNVRQRVFEETFSIASRFSRQKYCVQAGGVFFETREVPTAASRSPSLQKNGIENKCETRIEDDNVITPSEVSQTNDSHLRGLFEHGTSQCHHNILNDLALPQFSGSTKEFLNDLEQYFCPKEIPDSVKLINVNRHL